MEQSQQKNRYKTIVISDLHMGAKWSATAQVIKFLRENSADHLILCGDMIDGWVLTREGKYATWGEAQREFIALIYQWAARCRVTYIKGNHDDFWQYIIPMQVAGIEIVERCTIESAGRKILVLHGDQFDSVTTNMPALSKIGDMIYATLLRFNKRYNGRRQRKGLPYKSIASAVKRSTKKFVARFSNHKQNIIKMVKESGCNAIICGHTHHPKIEMLEDILYLNSGDWVESLSALVEDFNGEWSLEIDVEEQQKHLKEMIER